jgi:hypothetical protein
MWEFFGTQWKKSTRDIKEKTLQQGKSVHERRAGLGGQSSHRTANTLSKALQ